MNMPYLTSLMPQHALYISLQTQTNWPSIHLDTRAFPDEESYIRIKNVAILNSEKKIKPVFVFHNFDFPNNNILNLIFLAELLKSYGVTHLYLFCPYLAYMRQDSIFQPGEGVTAQYFATLLEQYFDGLVTIDPHLHRITDLQTLYPKAFITKVLSSNIVISNWLAKNYPNSILIGPDSESEQWVKTIAQQSQKPYLIFNKTRTGDKKIEVTLTASQQQMLKQTNKQVILLDDIISSAQTMIQSVKYIQTITPGNTPICVGIHALMNSIAYNDLLKAGAKYVYTTNTVAHSSNHIDLSDWWVKEIKAYYNRLKL